MFNVFIYNISSIYEFRKDTFLKLHFIHGFLGKPEDWNIFRSFFKEYEIEFHSIYKYFSQLNQKNHFEEWAHIFNQNSCLAKTNQKNIVIGYSLGGRLALHSLFSQNSNWDAAVIISANPGLIYDHEKQLRIESDKLWANRFLNENLSNVIEDWNAQPIFMGQKNPNLHDTNNLNRTEIYNTLINFSLSKQKNFRKNLYEIKIPLLWLSGLKDTKFSNITKEISLLNPKINTYIFNDAAHRVPWDCPNEFAKKCIEFLF